ncbi:MAG: hypothetical protein WCO07_02545 [bacterium]
MNEKITVNRQAPVSFSMEFEKRYGKFNISSQNTVSWGINHFTLKDIEMVECPRDKISGTEFSEHINSLGYVPLDFFHARAILKDNKNLSKLMNVLGNYLWKKGFKLETTNFFGTMVADEEGETFIVCYKFNGTNDFPMFMAFEDEPGWSSHADLAIVFKQSFIKKILLQQKIVENQKKKAKK